MTSSRVTELDIHMISTKNFKDYYNNEIFIVRTYPYDGRFHIMEVHINKKPISFLLKRDISAEDLRDFEFELLDCNYRLPILGKDIFDRAEIFLKRYPKVVILYRNEHEFQIAKAFKELLLLSSNTTNGE